MVVSLTALITPTGTRKTVATKMASKSAQAGSCNGDVSIRVKAARSVTPSRVMYHIFGTVGYTAMSLYTGLGHAELHAGN